MGLQGLVPQNVKHLSSELTGCVRSSSVDKRQEFRKVGTVWELGQGQDEVCGNLGWATCRRQAEKFGAR